MKRINRRQLEAANNASLFSFFSGAGFLDLGFEHAGFPVKFVNEYNQSFLDAYKYTRKILKIPEPDYNQSNLSIEEYLVGKNKINLRSQIKAEMHNGKLIGFIGGPPCPDFSIGGKNKGKTGDNGRLSMSYIELINMHNPDFFLFENVEGLWRTKRHREFYNELKRYLEKKYLLEDRLTNSIEFGVPQDRNRILLLGIKKNLLSKEMKTNPQLIEWIKYADYPDKKAFNYNWPTRTPYKENSSIAKPEGIPEELTSEFWFKRNKTLTHLNSKHCFRPKAGLAKFLVVDEGDDSRKSFKRLHRWRYSPTACYGNNEVHLHPYKSRRLSVAEALAVQSLPKNFTLPENMTLTNMFKTIGNGVPYLMAKGIANTTSWSLLQINGK